MYKLNGVRVQAVLGVGINSVEASVVIQGGSDLKALHAPVITRVLALWACMDYYRAAKRDE